VLANIPAAQSNAQLANTNPIVQAAMTKRALIVSQGIFALGMKCCTNAEHAIQETKQSHVAQQVIPYASLSLQTVHVHQMLIRICNATAKKDIMGI
jgi:hypothetical protein